MNPADETINEAFEDVKLSEAQSKNFWAKVVKTESCWNWAGCKTKFGYGRFNINGRLWLVHRISWMIRNGKIPIGKGHHGTCVLHRCDNPSCVNPDHLLLGTQLANVRDCLSKKRGNRCNGENHPKRKHPELVDRGENSRFHILAESQVIEIRKAHSKAGTPISKTAAKYGVHIETIRHLLKRMTWTHI